MCTERNLTFIQQKCRETKKETKNNKIYLAISFKSYTFATALLKLKHSNTRWM